MLLYRIKSRTTGLFSKGGSRPSFSKTGKIWKNVGHLRNHINQLDSRGRQVYREHDVEIVTFEIVETITQTQTFAVFLQETVEKQNQKKAKQQAKIQQRKDDQDRAEYNRLREKFG